MVAFPVCESLGEQRWRIHASAVCFQGDCILVLGPPASGKSSHAAYFLHHGGRLIGDDYVILTITGHGALAVSPVPEIAGVLALDGYPLMQMAYLPQAVLTHQLLLSPYTGNPLAFTGRALSSYTMPTGDVMREAQAFAKHYCVHGVTLPPDWMPQKAVNR